jgi:hypothetical protein
MTSFAEKCAELRRKIANDPRIHEMNDRELAREYGVSQPTVTKARLERMMAQFEPGESRDGQSSRNEAPEEEDAEEFVSNAVDLNPADLRIFDDGISRIQDLRYGLSLGYARPDQIRKLIEKCR